MIVYVYQSLNGQFYYYNRKLTDETLEATYHWEFLGIQEQPDIQPERKTVTKEARVADTTIYSDYSYIGGYVQKDAKNIRIVYEVEE